MIEMLAVRYMVSVVSMDGEEFNEDKLAVRIIRKGSCNDIEAGCKVYGAGCRCEGRRILLREGVLVVTGKLSVRYIL